MSSSSASGGESRGMKGRSVSFSSLADTECWDGRGETEDDDMCRLAQGWRSSVDAPAGPATGNAGAGGHLAVRLAAMEAAAAAVKQHEQSQPREEPHPVTPGSALASVDSGGIRVHQRGAGKKVSPPCAGKLTFGPSPVSVFESFASPAEESGAETSTPDSRGNASRTSKSFKSPGGIRSLRTHLVACHDQWPVDV